LYNAFKAAPTVHLLLLLLLLLLLVLLLQLEVAVKQGMGVHMVVLLVVPAEGACWLVLLVHTTQPLLQQH
jgi:hypothetical protein